MSKIENQKIGQKKRVEALIKKGLYHKPEIVNGKCIFCGKDYEYDKFAKPKRLYPSLGYCSGECFTKSGRKHIEIMKTILDRKEITYDANNLDDIKEKYKQYKSKQTKESYGKWIRTNIERNGEDFAEKRSYRGWLNQRKRFIIDNNIMCEEEFDKLSEEEKQNLFLEHFNKITKRGDLIKAKRLEKCGGDIEKYKQGYKDALVKQITNKMEEEYGYDLSKLTEEEYKNAYDKVYNDCQYRKAHAPFKEIRRKKTYLINRGVSREKISNMTDDEIKELYSEYYSKYTDFGNRVGNASYFGNNTQKGVFYSSYGFKYFYRSSWEKKVCETLESLINKSFVQIFGLAEKIPYICDDKVRHYYVDFKITFSDGNLLYAEVKPKRFINDRVNQIKFEAAIKEFKNFIILTEDEIFGGKLEEIILKHKI